MRIDRREWLSLMAAGGMSRGAWAQSAVDRLAGYATIRTALRGTADDRVRALGPAGLDLGPGDGALAASLDAVAVTRPVQARTLVPPDGQLTFAIDVARPCWVRGTLDLEPVAESRPGLRATILWDDVVIGAPMAVAPPWGVGEITEPAPMVTAARPDRQVTVAPWRLEPGRHYLTVAGAHVGAAGQVGRLLVETVERAADPPLYRFAFISDTHVRRAGREDWMNRKMGEASAPALLTTLRELAGEGIDFVIHGGDMTERATRDEFGLMRDTLAAQPLTVYGCIGNHDRYLPTSRADALDVLAAHFPGGALDYVVSRPPLRFVVFDVAVEVEALRDAKIQWLRDTLAADRSTPTVFVWHYPPFNRGGPSPSGFRLHDWSDLGRSSLLAVLRAAPNLVVCLNGHDHWDEVNHLGGLPFVQNAAFVEWPNTYRVFRVYADRLEWEVRQVSNRGFVRESCLPAKAMTWMIATGEGDLTGVLPFRRG
jgi:hypothetical protein